MLTMWKVSLDFRRPSRLLLHSLNSNELNILDRGFNRVPLRKHTYDDEKFDGMTTIPTFLQNQILSLLG